MVRVRLSSRRREESAPQRELELTCMSNLLSATEERVYFKDLQAGSSWSAQAGSLRTPRAGPRKS